MRWDMQIKRIFALVLSVVAMNTVARIANDSDLPIHRVKPANSFVGM